jgi:putative toxin-antitoxin system antitoxin component (TIGR02293 family)
MTTGKVTSNWSRERKLSAGSTAQEWMGRFGGEYVKRFDLRSELELARAVEAGLPTRAIDAAVKGGLLEPSDVYHFVVSKRTLQRRRDEKRLNPQESDKLVRVVRAIARAEVALGDAGKAERWIRQPNRALQGRRPLDLLGSDAGARAVEKVLGRLEHGIFS